MLAHLPRPAPPSREGAPPRRRGLQRSAAPGDKLRPTAGPARRAAPSSTMLTGGSRPASGTLRCTSPPPPGAAPRRATLSARPSSRPVSWRTSGSVAERHTSTLGSVLSLVTPRSVIASGCARPRARQVGVPARGRTQMCGEGESFSGGTSDAAVLQLVQTTSTLSGRLPAATRPAVLPAWKLTGAHLPAKQAEADEDLQVVADAARRAAVVHQAAAAGDKARLVPQARACSGRQRAARLTVQRGGGGRARLACRRQPAPVSFISTMQPLVSFSMSRSRLASKSRSPGLSSRSRMPSMRMVRPESVAHTSRWRRCWLPRKRNMRGYLMRRVLQRLTGRKQRAVMRR